MSLRDSRLYYDDPYLVHFTAKIVSCEPADGTSRVVLDRTAFYPTSGGQPHDTGTIAGFRVVDVVEDGETVVHVIETNMASSSPDQLRPGLEVECLIDRERRTDHMQQHAGQHLLSAAFEQLMDANTVGFHLGEDYVTIDLDIPDLSWDAVARVEELVTKVILENRPVLSRWITHGELANLKLRKPTDRTEDIRVVEVPRFDVSACGGTHPRATGEIGMVKVLKWERIRKDTRVYFVCGFRAAKEFGLRNRVLVELGAMVSAAPHELTEAVGRLTDQVRTLSKELKAAKEEILEYTVRDLASQAAEVAALPGEDISGGSHGVTVITRALPGRNPDEVRYLAGRLAQNPGTVALLAGVTDTAVYMAFARSADLEINMGPILREALTMVDGRGGGPPHLAQGGGKNPAGTEEALGAARKQVLEAVHPRPVHRQVVSTQGPC